MIELAATDQGETAPLMTMIDDFIVRARQKLMERELVR
jgi:hypothetical protein